MKFNTVIKLSVVAIVLSFSVMGCRKGLEKTTPLQGRGVASVGTPEPGPALGGTNSATIPGPGDNNTNPVKPAGDGTSTTVVPPPPPVRPVDEGKMALNAKLSEYVPSADQPFKSETVYFDFDKSTLKPSEVSKVERVASGIKGLAGKALRIEGHCDERGTEEYNRSLGERRALAVREALIRAGVDPNIVDTISYGEDRPADPAHNEAAWSKNRRGEFIVIEPPTAATSK